MSYLHFIFGGPMFMPSAADALPEGASGQTVPSAIVNATVEVLATGARVVAFDGDDDPSFDKRGDASNYVYKLRNATARRIWPDEDAEDRQPRITTAVRNVGTKQAPEYRIWVALADGEDLPEEALTAHDPEDEG